MNRINDLNISTKLALLSALFFALFFLASVLSSWLISENTLKVYFGNEVKKNLHSFIYTIDTMKARALAATGWFETSPRLLAAVLNKDRNYAHSICTLAIRSLGIDFMIICDAAGRVIYRSYDSGQYGDSLTHHVNVSRSLAGERSVGIEEGKHIRYSIRAGTPLRDQSGKIIGTVTLAFDLSSNDFLDRQKAAYGCEATVFFGNERIATTLIKDGKRLVGTRLEHQTIIDTLLKERKPFYGDATILGKHYMTAYAPVIDAKGDATGILFMGKESSLIKEIIDRQIFYQAIFLIAAGIMVIAGFRLISTRLLVKPIRSILIFMEQFADGNFNRRIEVRYRDEIGMISTTMNRMADKLEDLISQIITAMEALYQSIMEISNGNQNLSARTNQQSKALEQIMSAIQQAANIIKTNADNASEANRVSEKTITLSAQTQEIVSAATSAIDAMNDSNKKIGEITAIINDIAFQTNLLALNAAVEAARAGKQGSGFAVVAGEVRNLAQRSDSAALDIGALIRDSVKKIENGTSLVKKSGEALAYISGSITAAGTLVNEIASASDEQKQGISQINNAIGDLEIMTQQNVALVEETASTAEEMAAQARKLLEMMNRFRTRSRPGAGAA